MTILIKTAFKHSVRTLAEPQKKLSTVSIIGIVAAALVGLFYGVFVRSLYRKRRQRLSSLQHSRNEQREISSIPNIPVPQPAYTEQVEIPEEIPASVLGAGSKSPPPYTEAVCERGEVKVPTYDEVMADDNKYGTPHY